MRLCANFVTMFHGCALWAVKDKDNLDWSTQKSGKLVEQSQKIGTRASIRSTRPKGVCTLAHPDTVQDQKYN
jgi:hypothetical protein